MKILVIHYDKLIENQFLATGLEQTFITENKQEFIDKLKNEFNVEYNENQQE